MNDPDSPPSRTRRAFIASAMTLALIVTGSEAAWASVTNSSSDAAAGGGSPATEASLQTEAQEIAGQIQSDGRTLDELDNAYGAAQIRYQQLSSQLASLRGAMRQTDAMVAKTRHDLKEQALLAYLAGGAPLLTYVPEKAGDDPSLTVSYAEIIAGGQQRAVQAYRATLAEQTAQQRQLATYQGQARDTLTTISADQAAAQATLASERQSLSQVTGQLEVVVAQVEAAQQKAEQAQVESQLASQSDLPPASQVVQERQGAGPTLTAKPISTPSRNGTRSGSTAAPAGPTASPAVTAPPQTVPPATASPATAPPRTAPPATAPPATAPPRTAPPATAPPATAPPTTAPPAPAGNYPANGAGAAIAYAEAQLGKPYQWGGTGPNSFDCSGLVMMAWRNAGVDLPRVAQDQYYATERIPLADVLPGDLIFFGTPNDVYHVGLYIGGGEMIDAPETGQDVSIQSIYWSSLLGAGRV
jgi:peptidoglycan DL-endopeptidase CwlO